MISLILALALTASIFTGASIGASAVPPAFGPVSSSGTSGILKSALVAGIAASVGAVVQGGRVTNTVGTGLLDGGIQELQAFSILLVASLLVIASVITKYPMPTAFTVVGSVVGSSFAFGNTIQWNGLYRVVGYWVLLPIPAVALGYGISYLLRRFIPKEDSKKYMKSILMGLGIFVAFTAGGNSVGKAVGPLVSLNISMKILLIIGGASILAGAWILSPRIINAVSFEYSNIGPRRSAAALGSAALLAQLGIFLGVPISFNEAIIASIIGSGLVVGRSNVGKKKLAYTGAAWIFAFFLSGFLTYLLGSGLLLVF